MIRLSIFFLIMIGSMSGFSQNPVLTRPNNSTFVKKTSILLSPGAVKEIKNSHLPMGVRLKGNRLYPPRGFVLLSNSHNNLVISRPNYNQLSSEDKTALALNFEPIGTIPLDDGLYLNYCSCGDNTVNIPGDDCEVIIDDSEILCLGNCVGQNQGMQCSFTYVKIN